MTMLQEYKKALKSLAVEEVFDLIFYRPVAFLFVKLIYRTPITPNQLTILSVFLGLFGGTCYAFGTPSAYLLGGVFYLLYNIIDCSDGQLARLQQSGTRIGRILDGVADYIVSVAAYVGIGIGYASGSAHPVLLWCLTAVAGFGNAVQSGLLDLYRNRFLDIALGRVSILEDEQHAFEQEFEQLKQQKGFLFQKSVIWIYLQYSSVQRRLTSRTGGGEEQFKVDPSLYVRKNRILIHLWTYLGPTTQWTLLIVCSFADRLDVYLWGIGVVGNILAVIMSLVQRRADVQLNLRGRR